MTPHPAKERVCTHLMVIKLLCNNKDNKIGWRGNCLGFSILIKGIGDKRHSVGIWLCDCTNKMNSHLFA